MAANLYIDALAGTSSFLSIGRDREILYFFDNDGSRAWSAAEKAGMRKAFAGWTSVANIKFKEVFNREQADISEKLYTRELMTILVAPEVTALHGLPDEFGDVFEGIYSITGTVDNPNFNLERYGVTQGSRNLQILLHEIGHALGLDHPHDKDVGTGVIPGVSNSKDIGTYGLNQNVYTIMSYNDLGKVGPTTGYAATPMAFDIAAIQKLYGANMNFKNGDSVYTLSSSKNANFWKCIWDTGGNDVIRYTGSADTVIELRTATLQPGSHAGGFLSKAKNANGGFTIAKGVVIENASGGSGNDTLFGNAAANKLNGNGGRDLLSGGAGSDLLTGGSGRDAFNFDSVKDSTRKLSDTITDFRRNVDIIDVATIDANVRKLGNQQFRFIEDDTFNGRAGELRYEVKNGGVLVFADVNGDRSADFYVAVAGISKLTAFDFLL